MKLLIFDIDGTLTDTNNVDSQCFIKAFQDEFGIEINNTDWSTFKNVTDLGLLNDLFTENFGKPPKFSQLLSFQARFFSYLELSLIEKPEMFCEIAGASNFIDFCLLQSDIQIAFATGGWSNSAKLKLQAAKIKFESIPLSSSDFLISRQEILKDAIDKSIRQNRSNSFMNLIYFGDGVWDFKTTAELEIDFIGVDAKNDGKLKNIGATKIISGFSEIKKVFTLLQDN